LDAAELFFVIFAMRLKSSARRCRSHHCNTPPKRLAIDVIESHSQKHRRSRETIMVLRTTGASWLALMMGAERARTPGLGADTEWLLFGPTDAQAVESADEPEWPMAAE
jgi:hypothetical protein